MQKYDHERDEERAKFDLERDEAQRKFIAAMMGVKLDDRPAATPKDAGYEHKRTITQQDIMRNHKK